MREILFKGKRLDNGEWVYGDLFHRNEEVLINNYYEGFNLAVDPSTVGQYTGLCDKNGRKAFTADITKDGMGRRWVIFDCAGGFGICLTTEWVRNGHELHNGLSETQNAEWFTQNHSIIGNIHDNPELLEDEG